MPKIPSHAGFISNRHNCNIS